MLAQEFKNPIAKREDSDQGKKKEPVAFSWDLHYRCNYRCPYCWFHEKWQDLKKQNQYFSVEEWFERWKHIYDKYGSVKIDVLGGEPFIYPDFVELIKRVSSLHRLVITTNLSVDIEDFCNKVDPLNVTINPTFHPLFSDLGNFLNRAVMLKERGLTKTVLYLAYPPQVDKIPYYKRIFEEKGLCFSVLTYWGTHKGVSYPGGYTEKERRLIGESLASRAGENFQVSPKEVKGRLCNAGHTYAVIQGSGNVLRCGGGLTNENIGSFFDKDFRLQNSPSPCNAEFCRCNEWAFLLQGDGVSVTKKEKAKEIKRRRLGKTGLMVSEVGLGGHTYDVNGGLARHSFEERCGIVGKALELGLNFFDAADSGELALTLNVLNRLNARNDCIIAYGDNVEGDRITNADERFIREHVESQLITLKTDRIDILRILDWSISDYSRKMKVPVEREIEDISLIIDKLKKQGKVRFSGFSTHLQDNLKGLAGQADIGKLFDVLQIRFNWMENGPSKEIIPYAKSHDMGIVVIKPFRKGSLLNKYCGDSSDSTYSDLKTPGDLLFNGLPHKEKGLVSALLKFILSNKDISVTVPGVASVEQLVENANASIYN